MTRLILASASPARAATLAAAHIRTEIRPTDVAEDQVLAAYPGDSVAAATLRLARAKAEACAAALTQGDTGQADTSQPDAVVLGCDSMLELDGQALGKPHSPQQAAARIRAQRGRAAVLYTGHWLVDLRPQPPAHQPPAHQPTRALGATASTVVHFGAISDAEIDAYVATGEPLGVAGAFTIDGYGGPFITGVEGDHHNVVGLSLPLLRELLGQLGISITSLWDVPAQH